LPFKALINAVRSSLFDTYTHIQNKSNSALIPHVPLFQNFLEVVARENWCRGMVDQYEIKLIKLVINYALTLRKSQMCYHKLQVHVVLDTYRFEV
jgi:hypothetical protein